MCKDLLPNMYHSPVNGQLMQLMLFLMHMFDEWVEYWLWPTVCFYPLGSCIYGKWNLGNPEGASDTRYSIIKPTTPQVHNNVLFLQIKLSCYMYYTSQSMWWDVFHVRFVGSFTNDFINFKLTATLFFVRFHEIILGALQVFVNFLKPF